MSETSYFSEIAPIWEDYFLRRVSLSERDEVLSEHRDKLYESQIRKTTCVLGHNKSFKFDKKNYTNFQWKSVIEGDNL